MSKGSKRKSAKYQARIFKAISNEHRTSPPAPVKNTAYLSMSDAEIDSNYYHYGKADRTRMKREAARERLRLEVQNTLEKESHE